MTFMKQIVTNDPDTAFVTMNSWSSLRTESNVIFYSEYPVVIYGHQDYLSSIEAQRHGLPAYGTHRSGGAILCAPGDLNIMHVQFGRNDYAIRCLNSVRDLLANRGVVAGILKNDLIARGSKVASFSSYQETSGWVHTGVHFSINVDRDLITAICTKQSIKQPGCLSEFGIDTKDVYLGLIDNGLLAG